MSYRRIVLATDGSPSAETAERVAVALARSTKGRITVVHAYADPARAETAVARARQIAEGQRVRTEVVLSAEDPADAVLQAAEQSDAELIVIGSRGLFGQVQVFGNVVRKVATGAPCDVLLTRARETPSDLGESPPYARILIATDGSATADRASRKGLTLAKRLGASAALVFVGHPKTGELILRDTVATMADDEGWEVATIIRQGDPAKEIMAVAADEGFDLLIVGNRGLAGAKALLLGSVPLTIAEFAGCDVLIARTIAQSLTEIGIGEGGIVTSGDHRIAVYRETGGTLHVLSAKCTHMGCTVTWNSADSTWDCPCHGSRYAPAGAVVNGPATKPLPPTDL